MTIQEKAIEQLERVSKHLATIGEKEDYTDIAIQALEREPCDDCISRKAVKELFQEGSVMGMYDFLGIDELPLVTPKKDGWIPVSKKLPENNGVYLVTIIFDIDETESRRDMTKAYFCSQSKKWQYFSNDEVIAWMPLPKRYGG